MSLLAPSVVNDNARTNTVEVNHRQYTPPEEPRYYAAASSSSTAEDNPHAAEEDSESSSSHSRISSSSDDDDDDDDMINIYLTQTLCAQEPARPPLAEDVQPILSRAIRNQEGILLPPKDSTSATSAPTAGDTRSGASVGTLTNFYVMKQDNPKYAYKKIEGKMSKQLGHHQRGWGRIDTCILFRRDFTSTLTQENDNVDVDQRKTTRYSFLSPTILPHEDHNGIEYVAIKTINKQILNDYLSKGGHENPYTEIVRLQQLGDNIHVLECIEALEDDVNLYIVTPYCFRGTLLDNIPWSFASTSASTTTTTTTAGMHPHDFEEYGYSETKAKEIFLEILKILLYLQYHGICHHDISPDNFIYHNNGNLVLFDFAMSLRIPVVENEPSPPPPPPPTTTTKTSRRYLIQPDGRGHYGTDAYLAPEVYISSPYDGIQSDLWSASVILYNLLTGQILYRMPHPTDGIFYYYIYKGAFGHSNSLKTETELHHWYRKGYIHPVLFEELFRLAQSNTNLSEDAMEVVSQLLKFKPSERWTVKDVLNSNWIQN